MLVHHDSRDYAVASKEAANHARSILETLIKNGQAGAEKTLNTIEEQQPVDRYEASSNLLFKADQGALRLNDQSVHRHAFIQVGEKIGIPSPTKSAEFYSDPEYLPHFCSILNSAFGRQDKVYLTRSVNNEVRGFLSDKFRRIDSRPIVGALVEQAVQYGAVPIGAMSLDTKVFLKMLLPQIFEPVPNEVMAFGIVFQNSDFGDGALTMKGFVYRLWCTNLAMCEDAFRQVHLGRKVSLLDIQLSDRTYELDTEATASLVKDVTKAILSPQAVKGKLDRVKDAAEREIDAKAVIKSLKDQSRINKEESEEIAKLYNSAEVRTMPAGQTAWRLSNAISLLAQSCTAARSLELEDLAGKVAGIQ
jgi:hypothetical protein